MALRFDRFYHVQLFGFLHFLILLFGQYTVSGQQMPFPPPNQIQVYVVQHLNFGSFIPGNSGGSVIISPAGIRSATGTVILIGGEAQQAIFNVRLIPGRLVHIQLGPPVQLNRIGGNGSMTMTVGPSDRGSSFVTTGGHPFINPVSIGGTLIVGNISSNPAGNYHGTFTVTFIQE